MDTDALINPALAEEARGIIKSVLEVSNLIEFTFELTGHRPSRDEQDALENLLQIEFSGRDVYSVKINFGDRNSPTGNKEYLRFDVRMLTPW